MTLAQGHRHLHTKPWPPTVLWCLAHTSPLGTGKGRAVNLRGTGVSSSLASYNLWSRLLFNTSMNKDQAKPLLSAAGRARAYQPRGISHISEGLGVPMACTWAKVPSASPTSFRGTSDGGTHLEELQTPCKAAWPSGVCLPNSQGCPCFCPCQSSSVSLCLRSLWAPMLSSCQSPLCRPILAPALFVGRGLQPWLQAQPHLKEL